MNPHCPCQNLMKSRPTWSLTRTRVWESMQPSCVWAPFFSIFVYFSALGCQSVRPTSLWHGGDRKGVGIHRQQQVRSPAFRWCELVLAPAIDLYIIVKIHCESDQTMPHSILQQSYIPKSRPRALPRPGPAVGHGLHGGVPVVGQNLEAVRCPDKRVMRTHFGSQENMSWMVWIFTLSNLGSFRHPMPCAWFVRGQMGLMPRDIVESGSTKPCTAQLPDCGNRVLTWIKPSRLWPML